MEFNRLTFLRDISDAVEPGAGKGNSDLLKELENIAQLVFDGNWIKEIDIDVMDDLHKHRRKPYDESSVRDLLRGENIRYPQRTTSSVL